MNEEQVIELMKSSKSEAEWNENCDSVKRETKEIPKEERSGDYPSYWFTRILQAGILEEARMINGWQ